MKIYTRTGDKGETSLFTGQRIAKSDPIFDAIGTVDECNSAIGIALAMMPHEKKYEKTTDQLHIVQHALFDLGAALATPRTSANTKKIEKTRFDAEEISLLEKWMDDMDTSLPPLDTFILPGGSPCGAVLHLARSICRRAERHVIPLKHRGDVSAQILQYLNRLSDYFFMASRYVNFLAGSQETKWKQHLVTEEYT